MHAPRTFVPSDMTLDCVCVCVCGGGGGGGVKMRLSI